MLLKKKKNCKKCENIFDGLSTGFADGRERGELLHPDIRLNANSLINLNILNYSKFIFWFNKFVIISISSDKSIYIKLRFCLYMGPNHATFWLHTFQTKLWTKTPPTKFLSVCMFVYLSVCFRGFREKLLTIHLKTAAGIILKFHIWIRYLLTYVFSYITFWYLDPKMRFGGGRTNGYYQITPKLLTLRQIVLWAKL